MLAEHYSGDITHQQCVGAWLSVSEITLLSSCEPLDPVTQPSSSLLLLGTQFVHATPVHSQHMYMEVNTHTWRMSVFFPSYGCKKNAVTLEPPAV